MMAMPKTSKQVLKNKDTKVINLGSNLLKWQKDVVKGVQAHGKGYYHVVKSKRQCGKSTLLQFLLLQAACNNIKSVSICLSPTLEQGRKIFNEVKKMIEQEPRLYHKHNEVNLYISLKNGSVIYFKSAEQGDSLRGYTVTGIYCVDEAAFIKDDVFYETLPWVNVSKAPVVIFSTPKHKTGFFYKYFTEGLEGRLEDDCKIKSYDWAKYDTSALLSPETLENQSKILPRDIFRTEYLGEFMDNESGVFGDYSEIIKTPLQSSSNCYMGIDWGSGQGQDETAVCIFNSNNEMVGLHHFSDKDETETINYIIELMKKYKPLRCQVETNSIGQVFYGLLDKAIKANRLPVMLLRFITTNESKERLINNFQVAMQNKTVSILNDNTLCTQLDMYEMKLSKNNKRTYNAASGYHDDCIIAMLLAFDCISKGNYCIRIF